MYIREMFKTGQIEWLVGCKNTTCKSGQSSIDSCFVLFDMLIHTPREYNIPGWVSTGFGVLEILKLVL